MDKKKLKKCILCLDGGGIKGIIITQFLNRLEKDLENSLYDTFDMFGGTSTGSIIVMGIVYNKMSGEELVNLYNYDNAQIIMPQSWIDKTFNILQMKPKYDGKGKRLLIEKYLKKCSITDTEKKVLITAYDVLTNNPYFFKSWGDSNMNIQDAVDCSSAAPAYFPTVKTEGSNKIYGIDGAVFANNPCDCVYADALRLYENDADIRILSIGTGTHANKTDEEEAESSIEYGGVQWMIKGDLIGILMEGPQETVHYRMSQFTKALGHKYLRINESITNLCMDDVSSENIDKLKSIGDEWYEKYKDKVFELLL
jgi:uncharacterized protein